MRETDFATIHVIRSVASALDSPHGLPRDGLRFGADGSGQGAGAPEAGPAPGGGILSSTAIGRRIFRLFHFLVEIKYPTIGRFGMD